MSKNYRKSQIPDLRKKTGYAEQLSLKYINLGSCILIVLIITVLIASIFTVAAGPNSNFPANL